MQEHQGNTQQEGQSRYERGWRRLQDLDSQAGQRVLETLQDIAPDLATYIIEFTFGDIHSRSGLDLKQRQLIIIATLVSQGDSEAQLELHINAGLNVGLEAQEIVEAVMQCVPFTGFPRVFNALGVVKRVFDKRNIL